MMRYKARQVYKDLLSFSLDKLPKMDKVLVEFIVYPKTKRDLDLDNVVSITSKFFMDALVSAGKLTDDCYRYVPAGCYWFGGIDKENPRIEVKIYESCNNSSN